MCRLLAYKGTPIIVDQLIYQPKNSLVHQSYAAKELEEPLNGDGFGVGWYMPEIDPNPAVFVSTSPAWSNRNLRNIAPKIQSPCVLAHVRAASVGDISEANCHPFQFQQFLCMHNGSIGGFHELKRKLRRELSDETYNWLNGQTDSQHLFAVFLDRIRKKIKKKAATTSDLASALRDTISAIEEMKRQHNIIETSYLNVVVSDGRSIVGARFISNETDEEALSLYYSEGSRYVCEGGVCRMEKARPGEHSILIVSEKLTELRQDWKKVPANHFVMVNEANEVSLEKI